jgi:hypothetical protein
MNSLRRASNPGLELNHDDIRPFGRFGVGTITGHPVGLLVVAAVIFISIVALPEASLFLAASLPIGCLFGLFLWLRHRQPPRAPSSLWAFRRP